MKRLVFAAMSLGLFATGANANEFIGAVCLTTKTAACGTDAEGLAVGTCADLEYQPPNLGDGPSTKITILHTVEGNSHIAINHTLPSGTLVGTTYKTVNATKVQIEGGQTYTSQMRLTSQSPATIVLSTNFVSFTGNIANFDNVAGCTIGFRGSGVIRKR
ncbi:MAG: hypothetical protein ACT4SY_04140 [Hyphomicrobiales bacterium]